MFKKIKEIIVSNFFKHSYVVVFLVLSSFISHAQVVTVNTNSTLEDLIKNNLIEGCIEVSNISSQINGSSFGINSFGYFSKDLSDFPIENGIILTTGNAISAGNTINNGILNEGDINWGSDIDLEEALNIANTYNATSIEFDFISVSNLIQFNYILASEEYFAYFPCDYSDGFAFLIKEAGTDQPYKNIAVIPNTNIPVNVATIHDAIPGFCGASNQEYFDGYTIGDTNYNGRTTLLTASETITPYVKYHIKLVIADQNDVNYDSAVFIQGNSFNACTDLGEDVNTCANNYTIDADIKNTLATYSWFLEDVLIEGETSNKLNAVVSGNYKVSIEIPLNEQLCVIEDAIKITLNTEQYAPAISDLEVCDVDSDGIEVFDLSLRDSEILLIVPIGNYDISYFNSQSDAQNNNNPITDPVNITGSPLSIYVRLEETNNGCIFYTNFNLGLGTLPDISSIPDVEVCTDRFPDGSAFINLNVYNNTITQGTPDLVVNYHYSLADAQNSINQISQPYENTLSNETLFVNLHDTITGCKNFGEINITVRENPQLPLIELTPLNACETDDDGFELFDLTQVLSELLQGLTDVTATFYQSATNANSGSNPIENPANFQNTFPFEQTVYIRVENDLSGCFIIKPLILYTNLINTKTDRDEVFECDEMPVDDIAEFNLEELSSTIAGSLTDVTVTFYESQEDLDDLISPIDQEVPYSVDTTKILYIEIEKDGCIFNSEITLTVSPPVELQPIDPIPYCDTNDDGVTDVNLQNLDYYVLNGLTGLTVTYHLTLSDAEDFNPLPNFYEVETYALLYARATDPVSDCFDVIPIEVNVIRAPSVNQLPEIKICDDDEDGIYELDLNALTSLVVDSATDLNFSFYNRPDAAILGINEITNLSAYPASTETVYVRVESNITGCFTIVNQRIVVNAIPDLSNISTFFLCENDNNQIADFLFSSKDDEITNGQTDVQALYFENPSNATINYRSIDKNNIYNNVSSPQTIYVRVQNIYDTSCFKIGNFEIEVGEFPSFNNPSNYLICDDQSNGGIAVFDLTTKLSEISEDIQENLTLSFYTDFNDANLGENEIPNPESYTNIENPQQIFVRIENESFCHSVTDFSLNVVQLPIANTPSDYIKCDTDSDQITTFDLRTKEIEILDIRNDNVEVIYYESQEDLEANINSIPNPTDYENKINPQTVYVKVLSLLSGCHNSVALNLIVNSPPAINDNIVEEFCEESTLLYDLNQVTDILIENTTNISFSYHSSPIDAQNNINPLDFNYNYSIGTQTLYIRAQDTINTCISIKPFNIIVNPLPEANTPPNLEECDDDYDNIIEFDLSSQNSFVLNNQDPNDFTVSYYSSLSDAESDIESLSTSYIATNEDTIFVRLENNTSGCFETTSFQIFVNSKPIVEISDLPLCLNLGVVSVSAGETIYPGDTYLWSNNETTPTIDIDQMGEYWVTVTTSSGCATTATFNVYESESATIESTEIIDFSDPNNVTITVTGIGDYIYQLDYNTPQDNGFFENVKLGYHTITIIDLKGCASVTKEIVVIDAPKFLTPNSDSYFDYWHITGIETLTGSEVRIYDRYGKLLKTLAWHSLGWDGTFNGNLMPASDYWYVADIKMNDTEFEVMGHFSLVR